MKRHVLSWVGVLALAGAGSFSGPARVAAGNGPHHQPTYQTPATLYPFNGPLPFQRYQTHYYSPFSYQMPYLHYRSRAFQSWPGYQTHHDWPSEPAKRPKAERPKPEPTAHITIKVPADAEIWFDGTKMTETGPVRQFYSPPLERGRDYSYEIRLRWRQDGRIVTRSREVFVTAGSHINVDFTNAEQGEK